MKAKYTKLPRRTKKESQSKVKRGNKRETIIKVASRLMSEKGYRGVSLQEIADTVGIHKSSLFYYFKTKESILDEIMGKVDYGIGNHFEEITKDKKLSREQRLKEAIRYHIAFLAEHTDYLNVYLNEIKYLSGKRRKKHDKLREQNESYLIKIIDEIKKEGSENFKNMDSKIVVFGIVGMCNWASKWYRQSGPLKPEEISNIFFRIITEPVVTET